DVPGFGPNITTGLLMAFHPDQFSIWNDPSKTAIRQLGLEATPLSAFVDSVANVRERVGASDFLTLDWFLYKLSSDQASPRSESAKVTKSPDVRFWAIALGEGAR